MEEQTTIETLTPQRVPLGELEDGQRVRGAYAVRGRELRRKRNGEPWLKLTLGDASGTVEAVAYGLFDGKKPWLFPFEATSILLLVGIVGAIVLAKRRI